MTVATKYQSGSAGHPVDNPLRTIEFAIKEILTLGVSQAEILARGALISNDSTLINAIAAAVTNRLDPK